METGTYTVITKITHTKENVSLIQGYIGTGDDEYDFKQPIHIKTLVAWVSTPSMMNLRLQDFIDGEDLAVDKEFEDWKERYKGSLQIMKNYVPAKEVDDFIALVGNFIKVVFWVENCR